MFCTDPSSKPRRALANAQPTRKYPPMSFITLHQSSAADLGHALFQELSVVQTTHVVETDEGETVPVGSCGTIVGIWGDGEAYEVEFSRPVAGLATMRADMLRAV